MVAPTSSDAVFIIKGIIASDLDNKRLTI